MYSFPCLLPPPLFLTPPHASALPTSQVWVHIADPSRWVAPGSLLAKEAEVRLGGMGSWLHARMHLMSALHIILEAAERLSAPVAS